MNEKWLEDRLNIPKFYVLETIKLSLFHFLLLYWFYCKKFGEKIKILKKVVKKKKS